ncbi:MAG: hypothetical protein IV100_35405, partial [Myxococcales bacterium]|nr:hypothetical protein [Myxococcales bacterium]
MSIPVDNHGFTKTCNVCTGQCRAVNSHGFGSSLTTFVIPTTGASGQVVVTFDIALPIRNVGASSLAPLPELTVTISGDLEVSRRPYTSGVYATDGVGNLRGLLLLQVVTAGVFFSACGPMIVTINGGALVSSVQTTGPGGAPLPATCDDAISATLCPATSNAIKIIVNGEAVCVNGWLTADGLASGATNGTRTLAVSAPGSSNPNLLKNELTYTCGFGPTIAPNSFPISFECVNGNDAIVYRGCALFCHSSSPATACPSPSARKRDVDVTGLAVSSAATFVLAASAGGDPHLVSAEGLKFIFNGIANAVYALFTSPVVDINMQLAATGPEERYMTE